MLCSQQPPVIILEVRPLVYSLEMLVERVREAVSSTEQLTNTALLTYP